MYKLAMIMEKVKYGNWGEIISVEQGKFWYIICSNNHIADLQKINVFIKNDNGKN